MDDAGKYPQWLAEASLGQDSFPGEMGLQLGPERWTEGIWKDIYMGEMESYKSKQAASVSEQQRGGQLGWWQRTFHQVGPWWGGPFA